MNRPSSMPSPIKSRFLEPLERFLRIEAASGIILLMAAATALIWANSPWADSYEHLWHAPVTLGFGEYVWTQSLRFWINDGLMAVFFLLVGLEIRREMYEGALSNIRLATLPIVAALGGILAPAMIYLSLNSDPELRQGWAIPTATDIAFAVGVLALLGKRIPGELRILLLAIAIIDDIAAILVIAFFYSIGIAPGGLLIAVLGILIVLLFQKLQLRTAWAYVIPGSILWIGLLQAGVHPTLTGVILGLMTPVRPYYKESPLKVVSRALEKVYERVREGSQDPHELAYPLGRLRFAQREILPPVIRVEIALHPWVAYGIMPLFALANAGVSFEGATLAGDSTMAVSLGVFVGLVAGKPIGIMLASFLSVKLGLCELPARATWGGIFLVGCLGGIGFTMAIFIANLAFPGHPDLLAAAKLAVLAASVTAAVIGLLVGRRLYRAAAATTAA